MDGACRPQAARRRGARGRQRCSTHRKHSDDQGYGCGPHRAVTHQMYRGGEGRSASYHRRFEAVPVSDTVVASWWRLGRCHRGCTAMLSASPCHPPDHTTQAVQCRSHVQEDLPAVSNGCAIPHKVQCATSVDAEQLVTCGLLRPWPSAAVAFCGRRRCTGGSPTKKSVGVPSAPKFMKEVLRMWLISLLSWQKNFFCQLNSDTEHIFSLPCTWCSRQAASECR